MSNDKIDRSRHGGDLDPQEIPEQARCPECGAKATEESVREQKLSALGYTHSDINLKCRDCGNEYVLGVPIGDAPDHEDLWCQACNRRGRVHFIFPKGSQLEILLKCPECYLAWRTFRDVWGGRALVGHSDVTGDTGASIDESVLERLDKVASEAYEEMQDNE